jgi:hypothetical protein
VVLCFESGRQSKMNPKVQHPFVEQPSLGHCIRVGNFCSKRDFAKHSTAMQNRAFPAEGFFGAQS